MMKITGTLSCTTTHRIFLLSHGECVAVGRGIFQHLHSFSVIAAGVQPCLGDVTMASFLTEEKLQSYWRKTRRSPENTPLTSQRPALAVWNLIGGAFAIASFVDPVLQKYLTQPRCFLIKNSVFHKFSNTYLESILFQKYRFLHLLADDLALTIGFHHDQTQNNTASYIWKRHSFNNKKKRHC